MFSSLKQVSSNCHAFIRSFSSALYITGDKAQKTFAVLTPYIDFDERIQNKEKLFKNIRARGMQINIDNVEQRWRMYLDISDKRKSLERIKFEIGHLISQLMKNADDNGDEIKKLKLHLSIVKEDLKNIKQFFYGIEESAAIEVLSLPNNLHSRTPEYLETIVYEHLEKPAGKSEKHLKLGETLVKYVNPMCCYLKSNAALFELAIVNYFQDNLIEKQFVQFSNPDFARSIIVEGCGDDPLNRSKILTLDLTENVESLSHLHLIGGSSIQAFMTYFTRHSIQPAFLPLKLFCCGRNYSPLNTEKPYDLFNLCQFTKLNIFTANIEDEQILEELINCTISLYQPLEYHFRLVLLPAKDLDKCESLRLSIQMFSNYIQKYVEVGNISLYDDYISKRLLFSCCDKKDRRFLKIVGGTFVNVQKILGCILENNIMHHKPLLSSILEKYL